ncbi:MAG: uridine kinase [Schumannella sp.]|nr:uridine kinase [Schumannella sp.]
MARWSPSRRVVLESLADELLHNYGRGRTVVAVDGPTASGKSTFADDLAEAVRKKGRDVFRASIDDFLKPRALRYAQGRDSAKGRYDDAYDYSVFRRVLVEPFGMNGSTGFVTAAWDERRDRQIQPKWLSGPVDAMLIVDGSYLNRPELRGLWNASLWLDADAQVRARRMLDRDGIEPGSERAERYAGAFSLYEKTKPRDAASIIIDNTDPDAPLRVFTDSC